MIPYVIILTVAASVWCLCLFFSKPSSSLFILDEPNERSLHEVPKSRSGGVAIFAAILVAWVSIILTQDVENFIYYFLVGLIFLLIISYLDDMYSIMQIWRLLIHVFVASFLVCSGVGLTANIYAAGSNASISIVMNILTVLLVVWFINLYNFMDGIDGLAGGMGLIGFSCLAWFGWHAKNDLYYLLTCIVVAANFGFLLHNFPPAKIFMGDVGSIAMGYLAAFFSLWGVRDNIFAWWAPILIFSPFLVDATVTLVNRIIAGEKIWQAHKSHYYQKLVQVGWGHRKTVIYCYMLMITASSSVVVMHILDNQVLNFIFLIVWVVIYGLLFFSINNKFLKLGNLR